MSPASLLDGGRALTCPTYRFPYNIGYDVAGVVEQVGSAVASFKAGDEVYVRLPESHRGMLLLR